MYERHRKQSNILFDEIKDKLPENLEAINFPRSFVFRIKGFGGDFDMLSVSYPPDAMGNRDEDNVEIPETIEMALVLNDKLIYIEELGYSDVCRFFDTEELIEEINRLHILTSSIKK